MPTASTGGSHPRTGPYLVPADLLLDFGSLGTDGLRVGQLLLCHRQPVGNGLRGFVELLCQDQDVLQLLLPVPGMKQNTKEQLPWNREREAALCTATAPLPTGLRTRKR